MELCHDAASLQAHVGLSSPRQNRSTCHARHPHIWMLPPQSPLPGLALAPSHILSFREMASELRVPKCPPSLLSSVLRDEGPQGGYIAHHMLLPPSHSCLLLAFQHISMQENTALVSMETPSQAPPPQTYATRLGWHSSGGPRCPATPSLAWEPPPGFHQGLSDPFLWQRPRQPRCQATWSGARTSAAREMCLTNLSSLGRTEQQNCTCTQSELFAQLCTLCFYCFPTRTPSSHTPLDICLAAGSTGKSALAHGQIPAMAPAEVQRAKRTQNH